MSKAFEEINAGLEDAIKHAKGKKNKVVIHQPEPIDVKAIREKTGLSQGRFANLIGVSKRTLENWEQGRRHPTGPAKALLKILAADPENAVRALHA